MTDQEAKIARLAFELAADLHAYSSIPATVSDPIREAFIKQYDPNKPCHYDLECIRTGRCPREISCDH